MDQTYLRQVLRNLEEVKAVHDKKFSDNPAHKTCGARFDRVIENLKGDLAESDTTPRMDFSISESALPDAIEPAKRLEEKASQLEQLGDPAAVTIREQSRQILFKELNEIDGFDR